MSIQKSLFSMKIVMLLAKFVDGFFYVVYSLKLIFFKVRNSMSSFCMDTLGKDEKGSIELAVFFCQGGASANQVFSLSHKDELRREDLCCYAENNAGSTVKMMLCNGQSNQKWTHIKVSLLLKRDKSKTKI
jgi:hypothetical protein